MILLRTITEVDRRVLTISLGLWISLQMPSTALAQGDKYAWVSIPLTTPAQARAKIAGGEGFQQVMSIVYSPSNPQIVYAGSDTTKVWKSSDGGYNWKTASNGMDSNGVRSLFVHPQNENIVLAAGFLGPEAERAHLSHGRREGIFRSTDGGTSWKFVYKTEFHKQRATGSLFAADHRSLDGKEITLFAGSYSDGLLISRDSGKTWQKTDFAEGIIFDIEASPSLPGALLIATSTGLYRYMDGLVEKIGRGLAAVPSNIAVSPAAADRVVAAVGGDGIFVSNDHGVSFYESSRGLPPAFLSKVVDIVASPIDALILYAGTRQSRIKGPFYSADGGVTWKVSESINSRGLTDGGGFFFPSPIAPHPRKSHVALTASNGRERILRTENGGKTWYYSGSGYTGARVVDMAFVSPREWYLALTDFGVWKTNDGGKTFSYIEIPRVHPRSIGAVAVLGVNIAASIGEWEEKKLVISHDRGKSWQHFDRVTGRLNYIRYHPGESNVIYASAYRSDDNGKSWVPLKYQVRSHFHKEGDVVYGFDEFTSNVVESTDMGNSWRNLAACRGENIVINEMAADPYERGRLYLGTNSGFYRVSDGVCTRVGSDSGFDRDSHGALSVQSVSVDPRDPRIVYAGRRAPGIGTSAGVYRSDDFGHTWSPYNNGISGSFDVWSIEINPNDGAVYTGTTFGLHGLMRRPTVNGP